VGGGTADRMTAPDPIRCPYRRIVTVGYDPRGPDGRGRNRLRIEASDVIFPHRCLLRPSDLRSAWAAVERSSLVEPTLFGACDCRGDVCGRPAKHEPATPALTVRVADDDTPWLLNRRDRGWGECGRPSTWADVGCALAAAARDGAMCRYGRDRDGEYVVVARTA